MKTNFKDYQITMTIISGIVTAALVFFADTFKTPAPETIDIIKNIMLSFIIGSMGYRAYALGLIMSLEDKAHMLKRIVILTIVIATIVMILEEFFMNSLLHLSIALLILVALTVIIEIIIRKRRKGKESSNETQLIDNKQSLFTESMKSNSHKNKFN